MVAQTKGVLSTTEAVLSAGGVFGSGGVGWGTGDRRGEEEWEGGVGGEEDGAGDGGDDKAKETAQSGEAGAKRGRALKAKGSLLRRELKSRIIYPPVVGVSVGGCVSG